MERERAEDAVVAQLAREKAMQSRMNARERLRLKYEKEVRMLETERRHDAQLRAEEDKLTRQRDERWESRTLDLVEQMMRIHSAQEVPVVAEALLSGVYV